LRDVVGHLILISIPVILIVLFKVIFTGDLLDAVLPDQSVSYTTILTVGFILMFQIFGSAISFETLAVEFFSPMADRLLSTPADPRRLVVSVLVTSTAVSLLQTCVVMLFSVIVMNTEALLFVRALPVFFIAIVFNQLLGTFILMLTGTAGAANTITSIYGSIAPMTIGLYFPLPDTAFFELLRTYLTPMALANTAVLSVIKGNLSEALLSASILIVLNVLLFAGLRPMIRRIAV
jgi:ABC-2 type transport system permease protein